MMSASFSLRGLLAISVAAALAAGPAHAAEAGFDGAWLESGGAACEDVFSQSGKTVSFKKPVNLFVPAFIIRGNRLQTPQASCRIRGTSAVGERRRLALECATPVAVNKATALLSVEADGSTRRYMDEADTTGSAYKRCS